MLLDSMLYQGSHDTCADRSRPDEQRFQKRFVVTPVRLRSQREIAQQCGLVGACCTNGQALIHDILKGNAVSALISLRTTFERTCDTPGRRKMKSSRNAL